MPTLIRHRVWAQSVTGKTILLLPGAVHTVFQSAVQPTLICLAEHKSTKPNCFQPLQSVLKNISQDVPHHLKSLRLTTLALCGTLTAVCTTLLHSVFHWSLICVLWPTHFSAHQYVFNLQVLKGDSNCKQPKRYLSLTSKHNGVSFFQHGLHWGVNEKKMAFQDSTYWARPRTVQQLWEMNTQKCLFPTQSQTYSFCSLSSNTVPTVTAFATFPAICILGEGSLTDGRKQKCQHCPPHRGAARSCFWTGLHHELFRLPYPPQQHSAGSAVQTACCSHGKWGTICLTSQRLRNNSDTA